MMINKLYEKYFQKSKSFLYPILGIKRSANKSFNTYLSIEGRIPIDDMKLICSFPKEDSEEFEKFEIEMLTSNPLFIEKIVIDEYNLYVFDLKIHETDWYNFILGKYSKLSANLKKAIKNYYGEISSEYSYIDTYLYPEKYFKVYSSLLDIDVSILEKLGELCNSFDIEKETLNISKEELKISE